ncbi:hypothetical protein [Hydrogenimonas sp.]|nr:hypothetical protein [Hydrogenimonas sp.]
MSEELGMKNEELGMPISSASILNKNDRSDFPEFFTFHFSLFISNPKDLV